MTKYTITIDTEKDKGITTRIIKGLFGKDFVSIESVNESGTAQQRKARWLWCGQCAEALNEKHFDMRAIIREDVEIPWSKDSFMEYVFRPLMKAMFNKKSTNQLMKTGEMDKLIDVINKLIAERTNGEVQAPMFPSDEFYR